jgi:Domain of unknown function (DUF1083).
MKKSFAAVLVLLLIVLLVFPVSALDPGYTYQCAKAVYPVTADGVVTGNEWDDSNALVVNADNQTFKDFGRWQGNGNNKTAADLSVTYKFKWDDTNLYILEQRMDTSFIMAGDSTAGATPWNGDGTLMFLAYNSTGTFVWADAYEPFWAMSEDGKISFGLRSWVTGTFVNDQNNMENWKGDGKYDAGTKTLTVELIVPFSDIGTVSGSKTVAVGANLRFTPIIPNIDKADDYLTFAGSWDQLNFHDRGNRTDADLTEASNPAECPINWAGMTLTDAIVSTETEAPVTEAPAATDTTATTTAPTTMDTALLVSFAGLALASGLIVVSKKRK